MTLSTNSSPPAPSRAAKKRRFSSSVSPPLELGLVRLEVIDGKVTDKLEEDDDEEGDAEEEESD